MITWYTLYDLQTGRITATFTSDPESLEANTPPGRGVIGGSYDYQQGYISNGEFVEFPPPPASYYAWDWTTHTWINPRTLQWYKDQKWEEIKVSRDIAINAPLDTPYGIFDADPNSRANIANSVLYLQTLEQQGTPGTVDWTLADNTTITLNYQEMSDVGVLLGQRTNAAYDTSRALRTQIDAATTVEEVEAIHWPV